jgi:hypothetical protein
MSNSLLNFILGIAHDTRIKRLPWQLPPFQPSTGSKIFSSPTSAAPRWSKYVPIGPYRLKETTRGRFVASDGTVYRLHSDGSLRHANRRIKRKGYKNV